MRQELCFEELFSNALSAARFVLGPEFASRAPEIAEDAICNVILRFKEQDSYEGLKNARAYVLRTSRNAALKYWRHESRFIEFESAGEPHLNGGLCANNSIPSIFMEEKEGAEAFILLISTLRSPVLERLSKQDYKMIRWSVWEERSLNEIAHMLCLTAVTVRQRFSRLLRRIHEMLLDEVERSNPYILNELSMDILSDRGQMGHLLKLVWIDGLEGTESLLSCIDIIRSKKHSTWMR